MIKTSFYFSGFGLATDFNTTNLALYSYNDYTRLGFSNYDTNMGSNRIEDVIRVPTSMESSAHISVNFVGV